MKTKMQENKEVSFTKKSSFARTLTEKSEKNPGNEVISCYFNLINCDPM